MKMRDPNEIFLKKIHNSFFGLSIAITVLSTILAFMKPESIICQASMYGNCFTESYDTLNTYISMLILSAFFLIISVIIYLIRRIIITRPSTRILEEIESRKYK
jgi:hypothetical protein